MDNDPEMAHFGSMSYLWTSDLKQRAAKVLAAALKKPQYVFRNGEVFVIKRVVLTDVPDSGDGDMARVIADTWDKLGPAPEIDYDKPASTMPDHRSGIKTSCHLTLKFDLPQPLKQIGGYSCGQVSLRLGI